MKDTKDKGGAEYRSLQFPGANIEVSPFGNEKLPGGLSIRDTIKFLIQRYIDYRDKEIKGEDAFLDKVAES